jgi:hypothetical protein
MKQKSIKKGDTLDLELLKSKKIYIGLVSLFLFSGCTQTSMIKSQKKVTEPLWLKEILPTAQAFGCEVKKTKSINKKNLEKVAFFKAKKNFITKKNTFINSATTSKLTNDGEKINKNTMQNSHGNFGKNDFEVLDRFEDSKKYCILIEYKK